MKILNGLADAVQEGGFYLLLFWLPFSIAAIEVTFVVIATSWLLQQYGLRGRTESLWRQPAQRALLVSIGVYLLVCGLSIAVSDYPEKGIRAWFTKWAEYLLMFMVTADLVRRNHRLARWGFVVLACSVFLVVVEAVVQEFTGRGPLRGFPLSSYSRMTGPYKDPIDLATYVMVLTPVMLTYAFTRQGFSRWLLGALVLLLVGCLVRTETIGAWLALCAGVGAVMIRFRTIRRHAMVALGVLVLAAMAYLWHSPRLRTAFTLHDLGNSDRIVMWQAAVGMINDRPILGHGLNTFMAKYLDYWVGGERQPRYAHNCYLQVAAETGLIGLAAFLALLWCFFARLFDQLDHRDVRDRLVMIGLIAGLLAFAIQAAVDTNFYVVRQAALFWVLAGMALGIHEQSISDQSSAFCPDRPAR